MQHNTAFAARVVELNEEFANKDAHHVLDAVLNEQIIGRTALLSSFGAESAPLLHMASQIDKSVPVLFLDTGFIFPETLEYLSSLADFLGLKNIEHIRPDPKRIQVFDSDGQLHERDPDECCNLRKTAPLNRALIEYSSWITGRKRYQSEERRDLSIFELDPVTNRIKINPLVNWTPEELKAYMSEHELPSHPLISNGYPSIGCMPCTSRVEEGEDPRAGRWRNTEKNTCGIHLSEKPDQTAKKGPIMSVIVDDEGFHQSEIVEYDGQKNLWLDSDADFLRIDWSSAELITVEFPSFSDGRGFGIARQLRSQGYQNRLRASGHVIADQYTMARRVGFDEVEISEELAKRQDASQWRARSDWKRFDYQSRLGQEGAAN